MFKSVRWKSEKNKITALFKLRFHATQVSQLGGNALVLSLVPADTGKPTTKLDKYEIRDGCCYWENPIFETVKFMQDPKTGKIHDRIYNCTISTGSSKSSVLGEVSVNIAEYAGAVKAVSVSFPFKGTDSDVVLHVLIQRIQGNGNQRELEEHEGAIINPEDKSLKRNASNGDTKVNINMDSTDEEHLKKTVPNIAELNDNRSASIESDSTLSSSESSSGLNTPRELAMVCNNTLLDSITHKQQRTQWGLLEAPVHDSTDDSTNSPSDAFPSGRSQLALDHSSEKLKSYLVLLSRKAEMSDLELQTLRKQIVKERKRGQDLLKEVACLKVERDALKEECEKLKAPQKGKDESKAIIKLSYDEDPWALLEETRQELNHVKDLNVCLQLQLENIQVSNSELTLAAQDLKQSKTGILDFSVKQVSGKIPEILEERFLQGQGLSDDDEEQKALEEIVKQHADAKETYILEQRIMDLCSEIELYRRDKDELEMQMEQLALDYEILKQENHDMSHKLDQSCMQEQQKLQYECSGSYTATNELENQLKELEREFKEQSNGLTDSLSSIKVLKSHVHNPEHELEKQAQEFKDELEAVPHVEKEHPSISADEALRLDKLEVHLKQKSEEHSDALATIKELEDHIQSLGEELDKQAQGFESDLEALTHAKVEQEKRAIRAEEALRLTKWKNANTAGRIQDEFRRLSMQMQTTFEANEKVAAKVMTEASELRMINYHLEQLMQQAREELQSVKNDYEAQIYDLHNRLTLKSNQIEEMLNQLNHQREQEDEICQSLSAEREELEQMKALVKKRDLLVWRVKMERENFEFAVDSVNKQAEKSLEELNTKNEKDMALLNLQSEVNTLKAHCEELRHYLYEDKLEKEKLREEVTLLEAELKKDDALTTMERKLKDNNGQAALAERTKVGSEKSMTELATFDSEEAINLKEKIKMLEVDLNADGLKLNDDPYKPVDSKFETSANRIKENDAQLSSSTMNSRDEYVLYDLFKEMASLREKNTSMENELKELQDRYSEMSVNFAEVEGERQMLVMTLRSLKNARKI